MKTNPQQSLMIEPVQNGYRVLPFSGLHRDSYPRSESAHVFESFETLVAHLREELPVHPVTK